MRSGSLVIAFEGARVLLTRGTAYRRFTFGINLVALRIGQRGNYNVSPFLQDARVGYTPARHLDLEFGLLLMPLSRAALQAAGARETRRRLVQR